VEETTTNSPTMAGLLVSQSNQNTESQILSPHEDQRPGKIRISLAREKPIKDREDQERRGEEGGEKITERLKQTEGTGAFSQRGANRKKTGNKERGNNIENRGRRRTRRGKGENRETDDEQTTKENKNKEKSRGGVRWTSNLKLSNTIIFTFKLQLQVRPSSSCPVSAFSKLLNGGKVIVQCTRDN
jgi:hypothetical protein